MESAKNGNRFSIIKSPSEDEIKIVKQAFQEHNKAHPHGKLDIPIPDISLVIKDESGKIVGGVITSMLAGVMHLEVLWVDEKYRRRGLGKALVLEAERLGKEKGYTSAQTWTFSFQAPEFYQSIGYKVLGIFDGYPEGITEYVLTKRLDTKHLQNLVDFLQDNVGFTISEDSSEESMKILHKGLYEYVNQHIGKLQKENPEIQINLVLKNEKDQIIGGIITSTILKVLYILQLWIQQSYRRQGLGKKLIHKAEQIAKENSCISGLAMVYSFQTPEFFEKVGYQVFGMSDGYPHPTREYYFKKKFES